MDGIVLDGGEISRVAQFDSVDCLVEGGGPGDLARQGVEFEKLVERPLLVVRPHFAQTTLEYPQRFIIVPSQGPEGALNGLLNNRTHRPRRTHRKQHMAAGRLWKHKL